MCMCSGECCFWLLLGAFHADQRARVCLGSVDYIFDGVIALSCALSYHFFVRKKHRCALILVHSAVNERSHRCEQLFIAL